MAYSLSETAYLPCPLGALKPHIWQHQDSSGANTVRLLLRQALPGLLDTHLKPLKTRIEKILASTQADSGEIAKRVRILRMGGRNTSSEHFQSVAGALLQRKRLNIYYHSRSDDAQARREISPQRPTHYRDNSSLQGEGWDGLDYLHA